ncbi:MAG: SpoIIE family protein phosphatase [Gammaproteobacteria bacterium]|nr:SpoIIE family protein phosphatase [Gammaproteobacteria bacterium]
MASLPRKILVVDDEPDLEHLLRRRLRRDVRDGRYELLFARDGFEALEQLKEDRDIELVLSDINMPGMTGLTLLEQIPQVDPHIRAVIVSAYDDMENIRTAMNRGAFDFITKPINFGDLKITIEKTLNHMQQMREALEARDRLVTLQNELDIASRMQQSILPRQFPSPPGYQMFGNMEPAREVGGDFFDVTDLADGRVGLTVADVSGKGVPAALFMMLSRALLKSAATLLPSPSEVLAAVNSALEADNAAAMFVTLFHAMLDPQTGTLQYANGGHNPPLIIHANGSPSLLPTTDGLVLGVVPGFSYGQLSVALEPGDIAILYTDGVTEAVNEADEEFGLQRLEAVFADQRLAGAGAQDICNAIFDAVRRFAGERPQFDDITCLVVMRDG